MLKNKIILSAILIIAATVCVSAQTKIFSGYVNGIPVQISLTRDGDKLSGTYFYTRIGKNLNLAGTIDAEGNFKLKETDASGKTTGEFSGKWSETANTNGAMLEGEWRKPNSDESLGFIAGEQVIEFSGGGKFTTKSFSEKNKPKKFEIAVDYPVLSGVNPATETKFNELAKSRAMSGVADFRKAMMKQTAADLKNFPKGMSNSMGVSYNVEFANENMVSISFLVSEYTGGAHGNYATDTLNFDLKTGKEIKLADLFQPGANYLKKLSEYSINDLKTRLGEMSDEEWIKTGAGEKADNFSSWSLTKKGLMITFDPYQVAAYAAGAQTVIIPYAELAGIWRKDKMFAVK
jgi:hypothetical protein